MTVTIDEPRPEIPVDVLQSLFAAIPRREKSLKGRPPVPDVEVLRTLWLVATTGVKWSRLPERNPSIRTIRRRLKEWMQDPAFAEAWKVTSERCGFKRNCIDG